MFGYPGGDHPADELPWSPPGPGGARGPWGAAALACARDIAARSPLAVQGTKRVMNFAEEHPLETGAPLPPPH